jgi:hypothetical protein
MIRDLTTSFGVPGLLRVESGMTPGGVGGLDHLSFIELWIISSFMTSMGVIGSTR